MVETVVTVETVAFTVPVRVVVAQAVTETVVRVALAHKVYV